MTPLDRLSKFNLEPLNKESRPYNLIISELPSKKERYSVFSNAAIKEIRGSMFEGLRRACLEYKDLRDLLGKMKSIADKISEDISSVNSGLKLFNSKSYGDKDLDEILRYETELFAPLLDRTSKSKEMMHKVTSALSDYERTAIAIEFSSLHPQLKTAETAKLKRLNEYVTAAVDNLFTGD